MRVVTALTLLMLTLAACGRVGYDRKVYPSEDVDAQVTPGTDAGARPDAAGSPGDLARPETGVDAVLGDAPRPADVGSDVLDGRVRDAPSQDAGAADVTPADSAPAVVTPRCAARPGALACWNFEDPAAALPTPSDGVLQRDTTRAAEGGASLRVTAEDQGSQESTVSVTHALATPVRSGALHLRSHVYVPSSTRLQDWVVLLEMKDGSEKLSFDLYGNSSYGMHLSSVGARSAPGSFPRDRWVCVEMMLDLHPTAGRARLLVDGAEVLRHENVTTLFDDGYDYFRAGVVSSGRNGEVIVNIDEAVASTTPVGCP